MILSTIPIELQIDQLAAGFLAVLDAPERAVLPFGLWPTAKVEALETALEEKIRSVGRVNRSPDIGDQITAIIQGRGPNRVTDHDVRVAVREAMRAILAEATRQAQEPHEVSPAT